jgi:hypothetical protein
MKDFSTGLFNNNFNIQTDEREKRSISPYTCYSHYPPTVMVMTPKGGSMSAGEAVAAAL